MMRLTAQSPAAGLVPVEIGGTRLIERDADRALLIAPFDIAAVQQALGQIGLLYPRPNQVSHSRLGLLIWYGHDAALLLPPEEDASLLPPEEIAQPDSPLPSDEQIAALLGAAAALSDISAGLCHLRLDGPLAEAALSRLVPLDLRGRSFGAEATARSLLGKIDISIRRAPGKGFDLILPRSMAQSAIEDLTAALTRAAAR